MHRIIPHPLWLGSIEALQDIRSLHELGIRAVVQLAYEEVPISLPREFVAYRFPLVDGSDNELELLRLAVVTLTQLLDQKFATLVCCQAGLSRSPGIAAAALARHLGEPFVTCLERVAACRPCQLHPGLLAQLQVLCVE